MKKGFELLKKNNKNIDISNFETEYQIKLPEKFKFFLKYFDITEGSIAHESYYNLRTKNISRLDDTQFRPYLYENNYPISIMEYASSIEQLFQNWHNDKYEPEWKEYSFVRLFTSTGGGIFLGTDGSNSDIIFRVLWDTEGVPLKVADNIFDFIDGLESIEQPTIIYETLNIQFDRLYKNWGEDFWRIREEEK